MSDGGLWYYAAVLNSSCSAIIVLMFHRVKHKMHAGDALSCTFRAEKGVVGLMTSVILQLGLTAASGCGVVTCRRLCCQVVVTVRTSECCITVTNSIFVCPTAPMHLTRVTDGLFYSNRKCEGSSAEGIFMLALPLMVVQHCVSGLYSVSYLLA
jgi:hypothetical protein